MSDTPNKQTSPYDWFALEFTKHVERGIELVERGGTSEDYTTQHYNLMHLESAAKEKGLNDQAISIVKHEVFVKYGLIGKRGCHGCT
ncbi:MAG TPA: hypothetical protein PLF31_00345 [Candidatus Paceibacterota bacterium]|nr:hypothetical protein [Candidatus Paceibacterota bacterium]